MIQHCNVVSYVESWTTRTALYIVMEFCDKGDLEGIVKARRGKLFSEERILDWFVQMCLALKHIHDRKILHRDLKTANIFVMSGGMLKLGDFGIAKVLANTGELAKTAIGKRMVPYGNFACVDLSIAQVHRTTCRPSCVVSSDTITNLTFGRLVAFFMSCAHYVIRLKPEICVDLCRRFFAANTRLFHGHTLAILAS